jgi:plastocyanin
MRRLLLLLPVAGLAAIAAAAAWAAATKTVQVTKNGFTPSSITVDQGDTVVWHNADTKTHQVVADSGAFASPALRSGASWSYTASRPGTFHYRDTYATSHRGTVTVKPPPATLSLAPSLPTVIYGSATNVSGVVSTQAPNLAVTLTSQAYGKSVQSVASTTTQDGGRFFFGVTPTIQTVYTAHLGSSNSTPATVNVAPRVGLGLKGHDFIAKVTSDLTYGGHYVVVQKRNAVGGWYSFKRVSLGNDSRAVFRLMLPRGRYVLRLVLPPSQTGAGYVQGISRLLPIARK